MYSDRLLLTGWSFFGKYHRELPLGQLEKIGFEDNQLLLDLRTGKQLSLIVDDAATWANLIEAQLKVQNDLKSDS